MRKNMICFLTAGMVLLSGCSSIGEELSDGQISTKTEFAISATMGDLQGNEATKAYVETVLRLTWNARDNISVVNLTRGKVLGGALEANKSGSTTDFSGTLTGQLRYGDVLGFIYPALGNTEEQNFDIAEIDLSQQNGLVTEQDKIVLISKEAYTYTGSTQKISVNFCFLVSFQKVNMSSLPESTTINEVSLSGVGKNVKLSINSDKTGFTVNSPDIDKIVVTPSSMSTNDTGGKSIYVKVPASGINTDRKLKVLTSDGDFIASYNSAKINAQTFVNRIVPNFERIINFPDEAFETYMLSHFDTNGDGMITSLEAEKVKYIFCAGSESNWGTIQSLKGIEYCTNLRMLFCPYNQIGSIDVHDNPNLTSLHCVHNGLEELYVNSNIVAIDCRFNNLTSMDFLKSCRQLRFLYSGVNKYTSIDVSNCPYLEQLGCDFLTEKGGGLSSLDLSNNPLLEVLYCEGSGLPRLDLSNNTGISYINCSENPYTEPINFSPVKNSLKQIWIEDYPFTNLGLDECSKLEWLRCSYNSWNNITTKINNLDLSVFPLLELLACSNSDISELDLSHNPRLIALHCSDCNLTELDFSNNPSLQYIECMNNNLEILDLTPTSIWQDVNPNLHSEIVNPCWEWWNGFPLYCAGNPLREIRIKRDWRVGGLYEGSSRDFCINDNWSIVKYIDPAETSGEEGD